MILRFKIASALGLVSALAILGSATRAEATSISGFVSFAGNFAPTGGTGLADATGIDILGPLTNNVFVTCAFAGTCTGDYASLNNPVPVIATYNDFTFSPPPAPGSPIAPLWTFLWAGKTYSFDLATVTIHTQDAQFLTLRGTGTLKITGFDDTPGTWSFSGDTTKRSAVIAFSSTATAVPEDGSTALFVGIGLLLSALIHRKMV